MQFPADPVVFVIGAYYQGLCNGLADEACTDDVQAGRFEAAVADATEVGPDVWVLNGDGYFVPEPATVERPKSPPRRCRPSSRTTPASSPNHCTCCGSSSGSWR